MTREELKAKVKPIVLDKTTTKDQKAEILGPIFIEFIPESIRKDDKQTDALRAYGDIWNNVIAEIVQEADNEHFA